MAGSTPGIEQLLPDMAQEWQKRAQELVNDTGRLEDKSVGRERRDTEEQWYELEYKQAGEAFYMAVEDKVNIKHITVKFVGHVSENGTRIIEEDDNNRICQIVDICSDKGDGSVDIDSKVKTNPGTGIAFLEVFVDDNVKAVYGHSDISFSITVTYKDLSSITKHFGVATESSRNKRWTARGSWSHWARYYVPDRYNIPQYEAGRKMGNCYTGPAGTAWAIVFGYLDRRGHARGFHWLHALYRSSYDGFYGSSSTVRHVVKPKPRYTNISRFNIVRLYKQRCYPIYYFQ